MGFRQNQESSVAHSKHQRKPYEIWMVTKQSLREHRIREVVPLSDIAVRPKSHLGCSGKGPASTASVPSFGFDGKIFVLSEKFRFVFLGKSIWSLSQSSFAKTKDELCFRSNLRACEGL